MFYNIPMLLQRALSVVILFVSVVAQDAVEECKCVPKSICKYTHYQEVTQSEFKCDKKTDVCCVRHDAAYLPSCGGSSHDNQFPWHVAITRKLDNSLLGSGALIHPSFVITTAHILDDMTASEIRLRISSTFIEKEYDTSSIKVGALQIIRHDNYNKRLLSNNIALIYLNQNIKLNENTKVICLPEQGQKFNDTAGCVVSDWKNKLLENSEMEGNFHNLILRNQCQDIFSKSSSFPPWFHLHSSFMCAIARDPAQRICKPQGVGSGGAPLICHSSTSEGQEYSTLAGLASWSSECTTNTPTVFTNVANFVHWADNYLRDIHVGIDKFAY